LNANGMLRGYMARHMKVEAFVAHVVNCVKCQLEEFDKYSMFFMDVNEKFFLFYVHVFGKSFPIIMTYREAEMLKAEGPYALDHYIWREIEGQGVFITKSTHYLMTVFPKGK